MHRNTAELLPYVPDLRKHKFYMWISKYHWVPITVLGIVIALTCGLPCMLWAIFLRAVVGLHSTWFVNSATHMWGSRRFLTSDTSTNSFWVALLTFGEGWHNNHHAVPQAARHGLAWYEIDVNWYGIWVLRMLGLAWDVKLSNPATIAQGSEKPAGLATIAPISSPISVGDADPLPSTIASGD